MDEFRKSLTQLWTDLSIARRISLVGTFVLVLAVMATFVYVSSRPKLTLLYGGLSSSEAAKIVDYLHSHKVTFELGDGGASVLIPESQVYETRLALAAQGIPRTSDIAGGVGFELFDRPSFGMSDFMQKANYYRGLQGELARTIKQMEEVQDARVMIVVPEERLFSREHRESKASVFIQVRSGRTLGETQVQAIRFLVASGVEGLQPNRVSVIDSAGRALAEDEQGTGVGALTGSEQNMVKTVEDRLRDKAQSMLDEVLGPGQAVVRVTADLDFDTVQETAEKFDPKNAVVRTETVNNENNTSKTETISGASGISSNAEKSDKTTASPTTTSQQQHENTVNQYEISRSVETRQKAPGEIRRITAAVFINERKTPGVGTAKATLQARTPQELKALEEIVKAAIGFTQGDARKDIVTLQEVEFSDMFDSEPSAPHSAGVMQQFNQSLPYVTQAFLVLLAGAILFYLRGIIKETMSGANSSESDFSRMLAQIEQPEFSLGALRKNGAVNGNGSSNGALTVDEMSKIIKDNPSNTAQAIKQWINRN